MGNCIFAKAIGKFPLPWLLQSWIACHTLSSSEEQDAQSGFGLEYRMQCRVRIIIIIIFIIIIIIIYPLTARVVGAPQMSSQPVSSIFSPVLHCPLGLGELQACPFLDCCLPTSSSSCGPIACWILARTSSLVTWSLYEMSSICGSTSFPWLVFFFGAPLWGSMIHKHTGRWMWQRSASVVSWNWEKYSSHSKLVSALYLGLGTLLSYNWAQVLEACDSLKLLPIYNTEIRIISNANQSSV